MPGRKSEAPAQDGIEKDFLDALHRLQEGEPKNKALKRLKAKGRVKITITNVAIEAGRSRTLIAMEKCRYPRVREMIKLAKEGKNSIPTTHTELIQRLRAHIAELRVLNEHYQAEATAHFLARVTAEKDSARQREAADRLRQELARVGKITVLETKK